MPSKMTARYCKYEPATSLSLPLFCERDHGTGQSQYADMAMRPQNASCRRILKRMDLPFHGQSERPDHIAQPDTCETG